MGSVLEKDMRKSREQFFYTKDEECSGEKNAKIIFRFFKYFCLLKISSEVYGT